MQKTNQDTLVREKSSANARAAPPFIARLKNRTNARSQMGIMHPYEKRARVRARVPEEECTREERETKASVGLTAFPMAAAGCHGKSACSYTVIDR